MKGDALAPRGEPAAKAESGAGAKVDFKSIPLAELEKQLGSSPAGLDSGCLKC
jgi:hypothetical protein